MMKRIRKHTISIKHALDGVQWALLTQPNYQIHLGLSLIALLGSYYFRLPVSEVVVILLLITIGLVIETLNTAIEATCDAITLEKHPGIKIAKDTAAGAMLIFAFGAVIISAVIFVPRIF